MTDGSRRRRWRLATPLGALVLAAGALQALAAFEHLDQGPRADEKLYYPSGRFLREASLGYREMAADYLWFQTIQYYGSFRKGEHDLRYFRGLVDGVVTLDPLFVEGYYFASLVLAMDMGDVAGGIEILRRGIQHNQDTWYLPFNIGFFHYVLNRDFDQAAFWFRQAAARPDATDFARRFAAFASKRAGNLEGSIALWDHLRRTTNNPRMVALAERMIADCQQKLGAQADGPASGTEGEDGR